MKFYRIPQIVLIICLFVFISTSCEMKTDEHVEAIDIEFSYSPDPALVDSVIHFEFEPVLAASGDDHHDGTDDDTHIEISMVTCEVEMAGHGEHQEMMIEKEDGHDHYESERTFTEAGTYELHFGYMYAGEMHEKEFSLEVIQN